jgi:hypothetical protein
MTITNIHENTIKSQKAITVSGAEKTNRCNRSDAFDRAFARIEKFEKQLNRIDGELELLAAEINLNRRFAEFV